MSVQVEVKTHISSRSTLLKALEELGFSEVRNASQIVHYNGKTTAVTNEDVVIGRRSAFLHKNDSYEFSGDIFYDDHISDKMRGLKIRSDREAGANDFVNIVSNAYNSINIRNEARKIDPYSKVVVDNSNPRDIVVRVTVS